MRKNTSYTLVCSLLLSAVVLANLIPINVFATSNVPSISCTDNKGFFTYDNSPIVTDVIKYSNLEVGKTYKVTGQLFEVMIGKDGILSVKSTGMKASKDFTVELNSDDSNADGSQILSSGSIEIPYTVEDYVDVAGKTYVSFEYIYYGDSEVASLNDFTDSNRYIQVPFFSPSFNDSLSHTSLASIVDNNTLLSSIEYKNLVVGKEYTAETKLMVQNSNGNTWSEIKDEQGNTIVTSNTFTPDRSAGHIEYALPIHLDQYLGKTIASHTEIKTEVGEETKTIFVFEDKADNLVQIPDYQIEFIDKNTNIGVAKYSENTSFSVTVSCETHLPDSNYTANITLYDSQTNEIALDKNSNPCTKNAKVTVDQSSATVNAVFNINAKPLSGKKWYCKVTISSNDIVIASLGNSIDDAYCMYFPSITSYSVTDLGTNSNTLDISAQSYSISNTINYSNLLPNTSYRVTTHFADSSSTSSNTQNAYFVPTETNGTITTTVNPPRTFIQGNRGSTLQVTESLFVGNTLVAVSPEQAGNSTLVVPSPSPTATPTPRPTATPAPTATPSPSQLYDFAYEQHWPSNEWRNEFSNYVLVDVDNNTIVVMSEVYPNRPGYPYYGTFTGTFAPGNTIVATIHDGDYSWFEYIIVHNDSIEVDIGGTGDYFEFLGINVSRATSHLP